MTRQEQTRKKKRKFFFSKNGFRILIFMGIFFFSFFIILITDVDIEIWDGGFPRIEISDVIDFFPDDDGDSSDEGNVGFVNVSSQIEEPTIPVVSPTTTPILPTPSPSVSLTPTPTPTPSSGGGSSSPPATVQNTLFSVSCHQGGRTYYQDIAQITNPSVTQNENIELRVESDNFGNPSLEDSFTLGNADIWIFTSAIDATSSSELPNPSNYGSLVEWYDGGGEPDAIQLEVLNGTLTLLQGTTGPFTIGPGEDRLVSGVIDCGDDMIVGETGIVRVTIEQSD